MLFFVCQKKVCRAYASCFFTGCHLVEAQGTGCKRNNELEEKQNELKLKEMLREHERLLKKLELRSASLPTRSDFDLSNHINLVPPFHEKDAERYFPHFEHLAVTSKRP